ncbi:hypothetical protein SAMN04488498_111152 [Mesorhizobium albiziae]|uniref:Uncharacterized protein n=1 Tax=Neomesorhizobium albiziae TaxID=335020 RepID=A0A1I4BZF6_9HYPH|nr:hypothetical protein SAMN04488498_111152 [Mesorhizobium albiziae]
MCNFLPWIRTTSSCTAATLLNFTAWIPDTLRSFLAHEVGNNELSLPQAAS